MASDSSQNIAQTAMDFAQLYASIYDDLTASKSEIVQRGTIKQGEIEYPNLVQVSERDPEAIPICSHTGAMFLLHHIRLKLNRHTALGDLSRDEIAEIAGNSVMEPIDTMIFNQREYGIQNFEKLEAEGLSLFDTIYTFLTGLKNAGIRGWTGSMYQIRVEERNAATAAAAGKGLLNG